MKVLGLGRAVLVQPSVYGFDNAAMLDALREGHPDLRGVAVVRPEIEQKELDTLHEGGVRGARINAVDRAGASIGDALPLAAKIAALGWHLQLFLSPSMLHHIEYIMVDVKTPIVFDHFGNIRPEDDGFSRDFEAVRRLLGSGRCWVKLSAPYRLLSGDRAEDDHRMLVEGLVAENPERLLWASDWPHTNVPGDMPDDVALLEDFLALVPDKSVQHRILVENPHKLYWNS
jgi:predicted TIM-barrel fold metal-dependent hydrolase